VVAKLFNIVEPNVAVFGQKDFQQLRILSAMVEALDFPIEIIPGPTLREPDGLAMSSRNQYLLADERRRALSISQALFAADEQVKRGIVDTAQILAAMRNRISAQGLSIDYVAAVDPQTLHPVSQITKPTILAVAARVGTTRLIDNVTVRP
jgi:pantoate--beta-alanine ligase